MKEKYIFLLACFLNYLIFLLFPFTPGMDNAAHLYNSNLIIALWKDIPLIQQFFSFNSEPVPNWVGHLILLLFNSFLPAVVADKLFIFLYVFGLSYGFRWLVLHFAPQNVLLSYTIFPFIFNFLFMVGFYNFSISLSLMFLTLLFWLKKKDDLNWKNLLLLFILFLVVYFSYSVVFGILLIVLGIYILTEDIFLNPHWRKAFPSALRKIGVLALLALPGICLFIYFLTKRTDAEVVYMDFQDLIKEHFTLRFLTTYTFAGEAIYNFLTGMAIWGLFLVAVFNRGRKQVVEKRFLQKTDFLLFSAALLWVLYMVLPNAIASGGFLSMRMSLLFNLVFLSWIAVQGVSKTIRIAALSIIMISHAFILGTYHDVFKGGNILISKVEKATGFIPENSVIYPLNLTDNWLADHISNYLGMDKEVVILENYEADTGYFPVVWNDSLPNVMIGDLNISGKCIPGSNSGTTVDVDFILSIEERDAVDGKKCERLIVDELEHYEKIYSDHPVHLYRLKQ